jgi:hypothetical protein
MSDDEPNPTLVHCAYDIQHQTPEHHAACLSYVRHRYKISGPISVVLPGSCGKAQPHLPGWDEVRHNSLPVCACGRDRAVFPPLRATPVAAGQLPAPLHEPIIVSQEDLLWIRPNKGASHAHFSIAIEDGQLVVESDPIADIGDLLVGNPSDADEPKIRTAALSELAASLSGDAAALPFYAKGDAGPSFVFAVTAIDVAARQATISLGEAIEAFVPEREID